MEYIIRGLGFLITPIIVGGIFAFLRLPKKAEKGKVFLPKFFLVIGVIASIVSLVPAVITSFFDIPVVIPIILFAFSLLESSLIVAFINCRVSYDEDGFTAKNFFGIKRSFTYDQVTGIKEDMNEDYIYIGKHKVMIDKLSVGGAQFIVHVAKKYRATHNGQAIPKILKTKYDIFNGNVQDAHSFMFVYIFVSVLILAFAIFSVWYIYFTPSTTDSTIKHQVTFESYDTLDDDIVLTSSDGQIYKITFIDEDLSTKEIESVCDGKTVVTTYSKEITPDDEDDYYSVKAILSGDTYLLSFEETNRLHREEYLPLLYASLIFSIFWGALVAGSIIVGRNPKKYGKKIVKLFFKDGYVKY